MTQEYRCLDCEYIGEPNSDRVHGDPDSGEPYWVVIVTCADCGGEDLEECDEEETDEDFHRDQLQPIANLTRNT